MGRTIGRRSQLAGDRPSFERPVHARSRRSSDGFLFVISRRPAFALRQAQGYGKASWIPLRGRLSTFRRDVLSIRSHEAALGAGLLDQARFSAARRSVAPGYVPTVAGHGHLDNPRQPLQWPQGWYLGDSSPSEHQIKRRVTSQIEAPRTTQSTKLSERIQCLLPLKGPGVQCRSSCELANRRWAFNRLGTCLP